MVSRQDIRDIRRSRSELKNAYEDTKALHNASEAPGVEMDVEAYEEAQGDLQDAVTVLIQDVCSIAARTDCIEDNDGEIIVDLPEKALDPIEVAGDDGSEEEEDDTTLEEEEEEETA